LPKRLATQNQNCVTSLTIYDPRERALVAAADRVLAVVGGAARGFRPRRGPSAPRRILLLRLERIGDLLMALPAIAATRALAPEAEIDLVVGSWNAGLAGAIPGVTRVEALDAHWLSRNGGASGWAGLAKHAFSWRRRRYDLALNFEPDVRSNLLLALSGARWLAGFRSGGGGPLLDLALDYDTRVHTSSNATRLVETVFGRSAAADVVLSLPEAVVRAARSRLPPGLRGGPLVGVHASGGRAIKQWDPARFADVAARLIREQGATIVLTGAAGDRLLVDHVKQALPPNRTVDLAGDVDLLALAAVLKELDLFVTGDTGPMHLAAAVGTPVVAVFGPSDPARYAPPGPHDRVVRADLPCSPCNRIRRPPERCVGHTPDCLVEVSSDRVYAAALSALAASAPGREHPAGHARA
jgi:ADP-heptose:LPS heptosyltransferase